ncbi:hypothetical protein PHLCEN_2v11986 [Hermanssonia centrifuga]|uniref:Uncharacterized protein n=1 Tax=Hermanssonia centrifuga TaxID=98765 RepID=A0A2R6NIQ4_9APHY|nr:hypothetical protein PHLCEN_2v11986 [Hermanssonia centrifuga]
MEGVGDAGFIAIGEGMSSAWQASESSRSSWVVLVEDRDREHGEERTVAVKLQV